jgi:single-strand DNA-binding protein
MSKTDPCNSVTLTGRLAAVTERDLPSGDTLVAFRLIVDRPPGRRGPSGRIRVDALECSAYLAALRRRLLCLPEGASVEVTGSLRRRFWRSANGPTSIIEVEAVSVRRVTEAAVPR